MITKLRFAIALVCLGLLAPGSAQAARPKKRHPRVPTAPQHAAIVQTTANLQDALTTMPPGTFTTAPAPGAAVIQVNPAIRYQKMIGFGAAMTDSSAWLLNDELPPAERAFTMGALFGPTGLNLNFVRIPMAATDYTAVPDPYTYDDRPAGDTDPDMRHFSIAHDRSYDIPALKAMLAINPHIFTLATPWTAPPWMKQNQTFNNVYLAGIVKPRYYRALARYFVDFIRSYQRHGIPIDALTPMNEPNADSGWPGTNLSPADDATFLPKDLTPALRQAHLRPTIFGDDDTELADAQALLTGPARRSLGGIAFHCYQGMTQLSTLHTEHPSTPIIVSECSPGAIPYATAEVPIDAARNWARGVQLWNLALDPQGGPFEGQRSWGCPGCTGVVTINEQTGLPEFGLNYYQYGQTTKYVERGAVRIASTRLVTDGFGISAGVDNVAFADPDGSIVLVAYNNSSQAESIAIEYGGRYLSYAMAPEATDTFVWMGHRS